MSKEPAVKQVVLLGLRYTGQSASTVAALEEEVRQGCSDNTEEDHKVDVMDGELDVVLW